MKIRVVVVGPKGKKLGQPVCDALLAAPPGEFELCGGIVRNNGHSVGRDPGELGGALVAQSFPAFMREFRVSGRDLEEVVVFYAVKADALLVRLSEAVRAGFRIHVIGTTGLSPEAMQKFCQMAESLKPRQMFIQASNFSLGANIGAEQCAVLARQFPDADVEIVEAHHNQKQDAPSGTALYWARAIVTARGQKLEDVVKYGRSGKSPRGAGEICIHAMRGGSVTGFHRATFFGPHEEITVEHNARSSVLFGQGAFRAIAWASTMHDSAPVAPQLYHMCDVLGLRLLKELGVY